MRIVAALPLLALVLAGCSGAPPPSGVPAQEPQVVTDPRDLSYLANATPGSHVHDYWGGRGRITVLDVQGSVHAACYGGCADGMGGADERPEDGVIVPQGTRWVNGTFHLEPHAEHDAAALELWVKTAQDAQPAFVAPLVPGEPFSFESTQERNDPPHYVLSLWRFEVVARGADGGDVMFRGAYRWEVEAVRGLPLEPYPPHPDRWEGADELLLLQDGAEAMLYTETSDSWMCYASPTRCPGVHRLPDGAVVPHDAQRVVVRIEGTFVGAALAFHGADSREFRRAEGRLDGAAQVFEIAVADTLGDSPYAKQSLWEFAVGLDQPQSAADQPEVATGSYTIAVTAHR